MSDKREYVATLVSITNEQVSKADGSGTYPAKVLTFQKSDGSGTYDKKVPIAFLKKNTVLGEKIKEAESSFIGEKVLLCTEGYNLTHIGKPTKKTFSSGGKSFGGGKSSSYEEGAKRGHAITNAVNIAIAEGQVNKDNILTHAKMILEVSAELEGSSTTTVSSSETGTTTTTQKTTKTPTKKAAGGDVVVDDFDF